MDEAGGQETIAPAIFYEALYKFVIVGDSAVGKTNILNRFCRGTFLQDEKSTIGKTTDATSAIKSEFEEIQGVEFATKVMTMKDGRRIKAQIWDTAGQERYRAITSAYYRGSLGAIMVFSLTDPASFSHVQRWLDEVVEHTSRDVAILLIGTKCDLKDERKVTRADAEALGFPYYECSAKTGENVHIAVNALISNVHEQQNKVKGTPQSQIPGTHLRISTVNDISEKSCCGG